MLASKWHPDRNHDPEATDRFAAIQEAYAILSQADSRQQYDEHGTIEKGQSVEARAREELAKSFIELANKQGWRPYPYIKHLREAIGHGIGKASDQVVEVEARAGRLDSILPTSDDDTDNVFAGAIERAREELSDKVDQLRESIESMEYALEMIAGYEDTVEQEPLGLSFMFTSSGSGTSAT